MNVLDGQLYVIHDLNVLFVPVAATILLGLTLTAFLCFLCMLFQLLYHLKDEVLNRLLLVVEEPGVFDVPLTPCQRRYHYDERFELQLDRLTGQFGIRHLHV